MTLYGITETQYEGTDKLSDAMVVYPIDGGLGDLEESMATEWEDVDEVTVYELVKVGEFVRSTVWTQTMGRDANG